MALLIAAENALKESAEKSGSLHEAFDNAGVLRNPEMELAAPALIATARPNVEGSMPPRFGFLTPSVPREKRCSPMLT